MSYLYSQTNRLDEPHNYMYTPFQGEALFQSYQSNRMAVLCRPAIATRERIEPDQILVNHAIPELEKLLGATSLEVGKKFKALFGSGSDEVFGHSKIEADIFEDLVKDLDRLTTAEPVTTLELLHALIAVQFTNVQNANTKVWLDRLIQRFEVTKKIYESYPPGFRKGEGANTSIRLYWLFALALSLFYARSNEIKYLSTLLKVCDLLCSLPENALTGHIPGHGLSTVLATEIISVQLLAKKQMGGI